MIVPIPFFIVKYEREKTPEELRADYERWSEKCDEERREREAEITKRQEEAWKKKLAKMEAEREAQEAWWNLENDDEWEARILPGGWSPFGQTNFAVIRERNKNDFTENDL